MQIREYVSQTIRKPLRRYPSMRNLIFCAQNIVFAIKPPQVIALRVTSPSKYFLTAMIRVKNEARFLPEWLAYHESIGIEHVYVYDNESSDGTPNAIDPFIAAGFVTVIPWPTRPISPSADIDFISKYASQSEWVALLDADEFIAEQEPGLLRTILTQSSSVPAIALNFRYFGSSGFDRIPEGLLIANFCLADERLDSLVKLIAQPKWIRRYRNPHSRYFHKARLARDLSGNRVYGSFADRKGSSNGRLVLNHYVYRSREDYEQKLTRGFATQQGELQRARVSTKTNSEFLRHNDREHILPDEVIESTRARLEELGYPDYFYRGFRR